jgi:hypothetical protein
MKIALIGATGNVGSHVLVEALARGHQVTAIARDTAKLPADRPNLTASATDIYDTEALAAVLRGHDAVISAFNSGWGNPNLYTDYKRGYVSILAAANRSGVKRLLVVGGASSLVLPDGKRVFDAYIPPEFVHAVRGAMELLEDIKKETELDWTFLSPAIELRQGERTGKFRLGTDSPVMDAEGKSGITVADMAVAIVDEIEKGQFIRRRFTVGY